MKKRKYLTLLLAAIVLSVSGISLSGCGSMHSYWGVENDYYYDGYGGHHHKKPKHKKHKHKKYKHKKHHHHDDDDDD